MFVVTSGSGIKVSSVCGPGASDIYSSGLVPREFPVEGGPGNKKGTTGEPVRSVGDKWATSREVRGRHSLASLPPKENR